MLISAINKNNSFAVDFSHSEVRKNNISTGLKNIENTSLKANGNISEGKMLRDNKNAPPKKISNISNKHSNKISTSNGTIAILKEKKEEKNKNHRNDFSIIYQTNAGCRAINAEARHLFGGAISRGSLSGEDVIAEYKRVHGDTIFSKGNSSLKSDIRVLCKTLTEMVSDAAKAWYQPTNKNQKTHRGQGMTREEASGYLAG